MSGKIDERFVIRSSRRDRAIAAAGSESVKVLPLPGSLVTRDAAAVRLGDALHQIQAEAAALDLLRHGFAAAIERLEDVLRSSASMPRPRSSTVNTTFGPRRASRALRHRVGCPQASRRRSRR